MQAACSEGEAAVVLVRRDSRVVTRLADSPLELLGTPTFTLPSLSTRGCGVEAFAKPGRAIVEKRSRLQW